MTEPESTTAEPVSLLELHRHRNQSTLGRRAEYASHRARVTELLSRAAAPSIESLCILGAGNGNDIELAQLVSLYRGVTLVDLDSDALRSAKHSIADEAAAQRVYLFGDFDLSGAFEQLEAHRKAGGSAEEFATSLLASLRNSAIPIFSEPRFDCVASTCLLSQMVDSVSHAIGSTHPGFVPIVQAIRARHLATMIENLKPGGRGVFISDFVSSKTMPAMNILPEQELSRAFFEAIAGRNFFTGMNPYLIRDLLLSSPDWNSRVTNVKLLPPWRWDIGNKQFGVAAITFSRV